MKNPPLPKIKIAIAENFVLLRKSLISLLEGDKTCEIVVEAGNGKELIEHLKTITPDVILLNLEMPIMNGSEALGKIKKNNDKLKVIMISAQDDHDTIVDVMTMGASGFISKKADPQTLFSTIIGVHKTGKHLSDSVSNAMLNKLNNSRKPNPFTDNKSLSDRETAVMKEMCKGYSNKIISENLFISSRTVDFHKGNIYRKIKSNKIADVVMYAIKHGIIPAPANI